MEAINMTKHSRPMTFLSNFNELTMSSREIAKLVNLRHDNVKRTIETLAKDNVIRLPQIEVSEKINNLGLPQKVKSYVFKGEQGKRDSIIVVAQLCPEVTARLVDRWQELENKVIPKNFSDALRLAADLADKIALDAPKVAFADLVGEADGVLIGSYAKTVNIGQNSLFKWLRDNKILHSLGSKYNIPRDEYIQRGYFSCKVTPIKTSSGMIEKFTPHITGKGQAWLTKKLIEVNLIQKKEPAKALQ